MFVEQIIFLSITVYPTEIESYVFYVYFNQIIMIPFMYHTVLYHIIIISLYLNSEQFITLVYLLKFRYDAAMCRIIPNENGS